MGGKGTRRRVRGEPGRLSKTRTRRGDRRAACPHMKDFSDRGLSVTIVQSNQPIPIKCVLIVLDDLLDSEKLTRVLAQFEVTFSKSMIEAFWRAVSCGVCVAETSLGALLLQRPRSRMAPTNVSIDARRE
jgi:hypothetical protein